MSRSELWVSEKDMWATKSLKAPSVYMFLPVTAVSSTNSLLFAFYLFCVKSTFKLCLLNVSEVSCLNNVYALQLQQPISFNLGFVKSDFYNGLKEN